MSQDIRLKVYKLLIDINEKSHKDQKKIFKEITELANKIPNARVPDLHKLWKMKMDRKTHAEIAKALKIKAGTIGKWVKFLRLEGLRYIGFRGSISYIGKGRFNFASIRKKTRELFDYMEILDANPVYAREKINQQERELFEVVNMMSHELYQNKLHKLFGQFTVQHMIYSRPYAFREMVNKTFVNKDGISVRRIRKYRILIILYILFRDHIAMQDEDLTLLLNDVYPDVVHLESLLKYELKYYFGENEYYMKVAHPQ